MAYQDAIQQVIQLKKQYDTLSKQTKNFNTTDTAKQLSQQATQLRQQYNIDESRYGSGATTAQAYMNYYNEFGKSNKQPGATTPSVPTEVPQARQPEPIDFNFQPSRYDEEILKMIQALPGNAMNYNDAKVRADEQVGASYDQALDTAMKNIDRQSLQNGFFGQLPTMDYKQRNADGIQAQRSQSVSQLANQLVNQSQADVQNKISALANYSNNMSDKEYRAWQQALQEREYTDSRGDVDWEKSFKERSYDDGRNDIDWEKLFKEREYGDSRSDVDYQKGITEAQLTGLFKGQPTMALTQLAHGMNIDTKQMEMAESKMNHDIQMSWENLKNDKIGLGQAAARIGLQREAQNMDYTKFMAGIKQTAFDMTMETLTKSGKASVSEDGLSWIPGMSGEGSSIETGDIMDMMDIYTQVLLGQISADDLFQFEQSWLSGSNSKFDGRTK